MVLRNLYSDRTETDITLHNQPIDAIFQAFNYWFSVNDQ